MTETHFLRTQGLSKRYNGMYAAHGISLKVHTAEIVGLLGPNGAGKTTTFHMITGLLKPDSGSVELDGEDIGRLPMYQRARRGITYLPQEPSIFRKLTVRDNLRAVLEITGTPKAETGERIEQLLEEFDLAPHADKDAISLSGGERRRTEIARAVACEPRFMLFDEPFAGIDPIAIIELKKMIRYLKSTGIGILITDHNVRDTLSITDRAYIINGGEIFFEGSPDELIGNPKVRETYLGEDFRL